MHAKKDAKDGKRKKKKKTPSSQSSSSSSFDNGSSSSPPSFDDKGFGSLSKKNKRETKEENLYSNEIVT